MYKAKLQELCQRKSWELPKYSTVKDGGPDHQPRFTATVNVNSQVFVTSAFCTSSKEAQNSAAQIAFDHFNAPAIEAAVNSTAAEAAPNAPVAAPAAVDPSALTPAADNSDIPVSVALPIAVDPPPPAFPAVDLVAPPAPAIAIAPPTELLDVDPIALPAPAVTVAPPPDLLVGDPVAHHDTPLIYKSQLQQYTCRENLGLPVYTTECKGPPHDCRFKSRVSVCGKSYQTSEFFPTLKEAEQLAAKVACQALSDQGLYKNLLQHFAQKRSLMNPSYETTSSGLPHNLVFVSTVEIGEYTFQGDEAKTKKQAERFAARVAYCTLAKGCLATKSSQVSFIDECLVADNLIQNIQPTATTIKHEDTRDEDDNLHAKTKRAKPSTESMNVDETPSPSNLPSAVPNVIKVGNSFTVPADRVVESPRDDPLLQCKFKTVVFPRKAGYPIPEGATVMPFSDDQWIAYKMNENQAPTV